MSSEGNSSIAKQLGGGKEEEVVPCQDAM
jgi:hypothetical protein